MHSLPNHAQYSAYYALLA